jgi:hypothetical protein
MTPLNYIEKPLPQYGKLNRVIKSSKNMSDFHMRVRSRNLPFYYKLVFYKIQAFIDIFICICEQFITTFF